MALISNILYREFDKDSLYIKLNNNTGEYDSVNNPGGFGSPNPLKSDVYAIIATFNQFENNEVFKATFRRNLNPNSPTFGQRSEIDDILDGVDFDVTSLDFRITKPGEKLEEISDGVYNVNMYTAINSKVTATGLKYNDYISGSNLDVIFSNYNVILFNDDLYYIDKTKDTINGTKLYLTSKLKHDLYEFMPCYDTNIKCYLASGINRYLRDKSVSVLKECSCNSDCDQDLLFRALMYKNLSTIDFKYMDYISSNRKLRAIGYLSKTLNCNC